MEDLNPKHIEKLKAMNCLSRDTILISRCRGAHRSVDIRVPLISVYEMVSKALRVVGDDLVSTCKKEIAQNKAFPFGTKKSGIRWPWDERWLQYKVLSELETREWSLDAKMGKWGMKKWKKTVNTTNIEKPFGCTFKTWGDYELDYSKQF
eukprot:Pgem_evm1s5360